MTALDDAAQAVAEARAALTRRLHPWVVIPDQADEIADALIAAVRHHDAEVVRADTGHIRYGSAEEYAIRHAALIDPGSPMNRVETGSRIAPNAEVEARFADGATIRIAGHSVTADAETGLVEVEGFITSRTGQPLSGDKVRLAYLGIPGRGVLMDVDASVKVFSRLEVLNIRIRVTLDPKATR